MQSGWPAKGRILKRGELPWSIINEATPSSLNFSETIFFSVLVNCAVLITCSSAANFTCLLEHTFYILTFKPHKENKDTVLLLAI